jgi:hypothetical protein
MKKFLIILSGCILMFLVVVVNSSFALTINQDTQNGGLQILDFNPFGYATGTNDKAFLNATWKMSPREIERENKTSLSASKRLLLFTPEETNQDRFKTLTQKDISLWGQPAEIQYTFFDNMLYEYYVSLTAYDPKTPHKEILETLRGQFGEGKEVKKKRVYIICSFEWDTEKQTISYWMGKFKGEKTYYIGIRAVYKPFYKQIEEVVNIEKKACF